MKNLKANAILRFKKTFKFEETPFRVILRSSSVCQKRDTGENGQRFLQIQTVGILHL